MHQIQAGIFYLDAKQMSESFQPMSLSGLSVQEKVLNPTKFKKCIKPYVGCLQPSMAKRWPIRFLFFMAVASSLRMPQEPRIGRC